MHYLCYLGVLAHLRKCLLDGLKVLVVGLVCGGCGEEIDDVILSGGRYLHDGHECCSLTIKGFNIDPQNLLFFQLIQTLDLTNLRYQCNIPLDIPFPITSKIFYHLIPLKTL